MTAPDQPAPTPLDDVSWPLRTPRLSIRRVTPGDADAMWEYRQLDEVSHWGSWRPADQDDWREITGARQRDTLVVERDGRIIGELMLRVADAWAQREVAAGAENAEAELGWAFNPAHGGQGYATEAVQEILRLCFEDLRLRRVTASIFADNTPSWRLAERLGMRRETYTVKDSLHRELGWVDGVGYALLADEWAERRLSTPRTSPGITPDLTA